MTKKEKKYSKEFIEYQQFIIRHPSYEGMPMPTTHNRRIAWVAPAKGELGQYRAAWWNKKKAELVIKGTLSSQAKISEVARSIHPTKYKPCQTCGRNLSIEYVYLNKIGIKKINFNFPDLSTDPFWEIKDFIVAINNKYEKAGLIRFIASFELDKSSFDIPKIVDQFKEKHISLLSPGSMSNAPDRLDGFHSYNKCCRSKEDKGRSSDNMSKYGEDRRAYENWADGDWKAASWLMKEFSKNGVSADHVGPISLGFAHTTLFTPMTKQENSAKNNRMRLYDVRKLIEAESNGIEIVSWHTKPIWDRYKNQISTDADALNLSKTLRKNLHRTLLVLCELNYRGNRKFLVSLLNPNYAFFRIKIIRFNPQTGIPEKIEKIPGRLTQYSRNAKRYVDIAFESLEKYKLKENRKLADLSDDILKEIINETEKALREFGNERAKQILQKKLGGLTVSE